MTALKNAIGRLAGKLEEHTKDAVPTKAALDSLVPYGNQARTTFDEEKLRELATSIAELGVQQPLLVRPLGGGRYEIIAGERRYRAARMAGLVDVPVLVRSMDDATADKVHLAENIQRENLSTAELATRVQRDLDDADGDLAIVAAKYSKGKPWVSRLSAIAQGGDIMAELVVEGVTSDKIVLATVSSLERKAPAQAKALAKELKALPEKASKRAHTEGFMKAQREATQKSTSPPKSAPKIAAKASGGGRAPESHKASVADADAWRESEPIVRDVAEAVFIVDLSPLSAFAAEFSELSKMHGQARLVGNYAHTDEAYAFVEFGTGQAMRTYRANELRLLFVR